MTPLDPADLAVIGAVAVLGRAGFHVGHVQDIFRATATDADAASGPTLSTGTLGAPGVRAARFYVVTEADGTGAPIAADLLAVAVAAAAESGVVTTLVPASSEVEPGGTIAVWGVREAVRSLWGRLVPMEQKAPLAPDLPASARAPHLRLVHSTR